MTFLSTQSAAADPRLASGRLASGSLVIGILVAVLLTTVAGPAGAERPPLGGFKVHAYTLKHQTTADALVVVRPLLSRWGTVEEQPADHTLVLRDGHETVRRVVEALDAFDVPPRDLRFEIQLVRAGAHDAEAGGDVTEIPLAAADAQRLRRLLRYDVYQVLASAALTAREGEEVSYSLGKSYSVDFQAGFAAGERLKLQGFRILQHPPNPTNKGRRLPPRQLFHATLNVQMEHPFTLAIVPPRGEGREDDEALLVAINCYREPAPGDPPR